MNQTKIITATVIGTAGLWLLYKALNPTEKFPVIKNFSPSKYLGKWYEIARIDFRHEQHMKNVTAHYSLNPDGSIRVENRGYNYKKGIYEGAVGKAKLAGQPGKGKLKVSFFGPFYSDYNILDVDPGYQYALVAGKNHDYLWILSRQTIIPEDVKMAYLQKAGKLGYNTDRLTWVSHNGMK